MFMSKGVPPWTPHIASLGGFGAGEGVELGVELGVDKGVDEEVDEGVDEEVDNGVDEAVVDGVEEGVDKVDVGELVEVDEVGLQRPAETLAMPSESATRRLLRATMLTSVQPE